MSISEFLAFSSVSLCQISTIARVRPFTVPRKGKSTQNVTFFEVFKLLSIIYVDAIIRFSLS